MSDNKPVAWRGVASFDCNDDPLLCPRPGALTITPDPTNKKTHFEAREAEGFVMDPKTLTLKRPEELREERRWEV